MMEFTKTLNLSLILLLFISKTSFCKQTLWLHEMSDDGEIRSCNKHKLEILPGLGWDSLRGKEMAPVFNFTYNKCCQTTDGEFLIPDEVSVNPIRKSDVTVSTELIKHWSNYTDVTAKSVNLGLGLGFENIPLLSLSGSFSDGYMNMKQQQLKHSGLMTRTSVRHEIYRVQITPEAEIIPELKNRLDRAIHYEMTNESEVVLCILEFIIRDFGTHFIKSVEAGGVLYSEDFVDDKILNDKLGNDEMLKLAAKAEFAAKVKLLSASYGDISSRTTSDVYSNHLISSTEKSVGGDLLKLHASVNEWTATVLKKMGTIDRLGDPLFTLLSATHFPDVNEEVLQKVGTTFKASIEDYYRHNAHEGCMQMNAPNFDPNANINNGQCKNPRHNYKFGGIYRQCIKEGSWGNSITDCDESIKAKNPITGKMSCPRGYESSMLFTGKQEVLKTYSKCEQECTGWWFWKKCNDICHPVENPKIYNYQTYWCGAKGDVDKETGYMFGGIYDTVANDLQHCPDHFYNLKLTDRIMVCVSNDYSVGFKNSISFGGFFSCSSNNPIADGQRGCPTGYEQILVGLMDECEVKYCIRRQTQETSELIQDIQLVRPPYKTLVQNFMSSDPNKCYKEEEVPTSTLVSVSQSQSISVLMQSLLIAFGVAIFILFVLLCCVWRRNIKSALMTTYSGAVDYVLIPTSNGCKASKDFLATNVAEPTGTFLSTKIFSLTAIVSKTAYNSSKDFMSRAWASTRHNTNGYVLVPVVEGLRKSIEFTKNHVGEPMKLSWVKMKSRCMGAPNLSSQRENLQFLSPDCNAVLVDVAPQSVNPFSSTDNQRLIDNDSYAMCYGDKMNEKAEGPTNDVTNGYQILPFYDSELLI